MPTAAFGAKLLLPQLKSPRNPKSSLLVLHSPRNAIKEGVTGLCVTPRDENHRVADKSRELIETIATPREFHDDIEPRYTDNEQYIASLPLKELLDVICHFSLPDKAPKSYLNGVDLSEEEFYVQHRTRRKFKRIDATQAQHILAAQLGKALAAKNAEAFADNMDDVEDPNTDELGLPLWTVLAKRPMAEIRASDGIDDDLTRYLFKEYISMRNQEMASDQMVQCLPVTALEYKRPMNNFMSPSRRVVMDQMRKALNLLHDGFHLETHKKVCLAPAPPPMLTKSEIESSHQARAAQHEIRKKMAEQRRCESDVLRLDALRKKKEIHDLKLKVFAMYGISLRTIQTRWLPALYLACTAVFMADCFKHAKLVRLMLRLHVRMAVCIQRFVRKVQKKIREDTRQKEVSRAYQCIRTSWFCFKLRNVGKKRRTATMVIKQFLDEVRKTSLLRKSVGIYRRRIMQVQRWIRKVMRIFRARMTMVITSMNNASLKFKKDTALKRDSKKSAADSGKVQSLKGTTALHSETAMRRKSLVTFEDSKAEKQFYEKTFAMWNMLDKFSRAKVCERVMHKMYRSNRIAVIDYCTNLLPKWESWKAAENIRDSVKFQIGDASRRKRWSDAGTMVAPEFPRLRWLQPAMGLPRLIGSTILEVLPESMFSSAPPHPTSGKGSKASPRKKP